MKKLLFFLLFGLTLTAQAQTLYLPDVSDASKQLRPITFITASGTLAPTGSIIYTVAAGTNAVTLTLNQALMPTDKGLMITFLRNSQNDTGTCTINTSAGTAIIQQPDSTYGTTVTLPNSGTFRIVVLVWNPGGYFQRLQ